jgi:hypothetical protein
MAPKKKTRFGTTAPPASIPASLLRVSLMLTVPFTVVTWSYERSSDSGRKYPNALPRSVFVPLLVTTLTTPPVDCPNSAS